MNLLDIHHFMVMYFLIHDVLLPVFLGQSVLVLLFTALLSVSAIHLGIKKLKVDAWFFTIFYYHLQLVGTSKHFESLDVEGCGF